MRPLHVFCARTGAGATANNITARSATKANGAPGLSLNPLLQSLHIPFSFRFVGSLRFMMYETTATGNPLKSAPYGGGLSNADPPPTRQHFPTIMRVALLQIETLPLSRK